MLWIWIAGVGLAVIIIVAVVGVLVWRLRKRREPRLIALVALLREFAPINVQSLAQVAGECWNADLGDGQNEGADGFVVGMGIMNTIMHDGRMYLINTLPKPYVDDVESTAANIVEQRVADLFRQHQAWFSCDAVGIDSTTSEDELNIWHRQLGALFAELLDDNCLLIYVPETSSAYPINENTLGALRSRDPLKALQGTLTAPIINVAEDDPLMKAAVAQARRDWPQFVAAFESRAGEKFSIKAPITRGGQTEFIWIAVTSMEGERVYGELANVPGNLGSLKLGSKVSVLAADLNDWCYLDTNGSLMGGFTIKPIEKAGRRDRR